MSLAVETKNVIDAARFSAFVSYSHADAAMAKKLHRKIETYKLPKLLRTAQSVAGQNGRLGQIFRDREDLPAALDLSESVKKALARSEALIVLCSPSAKDSPWVAKEIELFRELHPKKPILAALIEGEPEDSFPAALIQSGEPLAADLRKSGDGWRLGLLKLVAGVAEVPLDTLVQRDAQRQFRSVMAITLATTIGLLTMIGMTYYAIQQRNEAQHQQAQAEGLVEYMLTDLRDELQGVGRLDVMTDVNERAMDYYEDYGNLGDMLAESLERRARILHAMGEDDEKRGDLDKALAKFTEAHRVTEELLARAPDNADRVFAHAQSEFWVGFAAWQNEDLNTAEKFWTGYLSQSQHLIKIEPDRARSFMELGYSHGNLCELGMSLEDNVNAALQLCESAIEFVQEAIRIDPSNNENQMALANRYGWMADALMRVDKFDYAMEYRTEEQELMDRLVSKYPRNIQYLVRQTWPSIGKADIEQKRKRPLQAIVYLESAINQLSSLNSKFPEDQHILGAYIRGLILLAKAKKEAGISNWMDHKTAAVDLFNSAASGPEGEPVRRLKSLLEI